MKPVYIWCETVKIIDGYLRCCVLDLHRETYELIPKDWVKNVSKIVGKTDDIVETLLNNDELEWLQFFKEKEFLLLVPDLFLNSFPSISTKWEKPHIINYAIINSKNDFSIVIKHLNLLFCRHIHLLCDTIEELEFILASHFKVTNFYSVQASVIEKPNLDRINELYSKFKVLQNIIITDWRNIALNNEPYFIVNTDSFIESNNSNLYYNQKIYIDEFGNIKNAPENQVIYGNINQIISTDELISIVSSKEFQNSWITKNKCAVCSDCEFRNMCIDTRLPQNTELGFFFYLSECTYNPYISKWVGEEGYRTLVECGVILGENEFTINHELISEINKELWGE